MQEQKYELYHHGIKGMKWGVRRYQNKDGSLTAAGRARNLVKDTVQSFRDKRKAKREEEERVKAEEAKKNRSIKDLSDAELRERINRLNLERQAFDLERQISNLSPKEVDAGKNFLKTIGDKVLAPALMDAGKRVLTDFANKKGRELLGLDNTDIDPMKELKKTIEGLNLQKQKNELDKYFDRERRKQQEAENKGSKKNDQGDANSKSKTDSKPSPEPAKTETKSESKVETVKAEIIQPTKQPFKTSNSNSRSIVEVASSIDDGRASVSKLLSSGYTMPTVSKMEGASSGNVSNGRAFLSTVDTNWTMRSLDDIENR